MSPTGRTMIEVKALLAKASEMRLAAMRENGDQIPEPSLFDLVEVA